MAEPADQAEAIELSGLFLEAANEEHLLVEGEQLVLRRGVALVLVERFLEASQLKIVVTIDGRGGGFLCRRPGRFAGTGTGGSGQGIFPCWRPLQAWAAACL